MLEKFIDKKIRICYYISNGKLVTKVACQILVEREEGIMEAKNKNILIGGLLAIVLVMAVGYAAFATQLNINGTANITSSWHVGFDTNQTSTYTPTAGLGGATKPTGSISFSDDQHATLTANFQQPGDKIVFTLTIKNTGTLNANLGTPVLNMTDGTEDGLTATSTSGNIKFTVTNPTPTALEAETGTATMTVTAEFVDKELSSASTESATVDITVQATQA